mmetsp:Transcript_24583/g.59670  ORF Transcript_24583/g.59670 Transcript_24583/m.59670 type:complete len:170 (+) Transcript_24583:833-1342(+)
MGDPLKAVEDASQNFGRSLGSCLLCIAKAGSAGLVDCGVPVPHGRACKVHPPTQSPPQRLAPVAAICKICSLVSSVGESGKLELVPVGFRGVERAGGGQSDGEMCIVVRQGATLEGGCRSLAGGYLAQASGWGTCARRVPGHSDHNRRGISSLAQTPPSQARTGRVHEC